LSRRHRPPPVPSPPLRGGRGAISAGLLPRTAPKQDTSSCWHRPPPVPSPPLRWGRGAIGAGLLPRTAPKQDTSSCWHSPPPVPSPPLRGGGGGWAGQGAHAPPHNTAPPP